WAVRTSSRRWYSAPPRSGWSCRRGSTSCPTRPAPSPAPASRWGCGPPAWREVSAWRSRSRSGQRSDSPRSGCRSSWRPGARDRVSRRRGPGGLAVQHETLTEQGVELDLPDDLGDCALPTKIAIYRILQEALANGHRHSGASEQRVIVEREGGSLTLTVSDRGRGFNPERVLASEEGVGVEGGHFGLRGIQDRVEMLGGAFALESAPGRGTSLTVTLPAE